MSVVSNVMPGLWTPGPAEQKKQEDEKKQEQRQPAEHVICELRQRFREQKSQTEDDEPVAIEVVDESNNAPPPTSSSSPVETTSRIVTQRRMGLRPQKGVYESGFIATRGIAAAHVDNQSSLPTFSRPPEHNPLEESANRLAQRVIDKQFEAMAFAFYFLANYVFLLCDRMAVVLKLDRGFDIVCGIFSFSRWCFVTVPGFGFIAITLFCGWLWQLCGAFLNNFFRIIVFLIALSVIVNLCLAIAGYRGPVNQTTRPMQWNGRDPRFVVPVDRETERVRNEGLCMETKMPRYHGGPPGPKGRTLEDEQKAEEAKRKEMEAMAKKMVQEALKEAKVQADKEHFEREQAIFKQFAHIRDGGHVKGNFEMKEEKVMSL